MALRWRGSLRRRLPRRLTTATTTKSRVRGLPASQCTALCVAVICCNKTKIAAHKTAAASHPLNQHRVRITSTRWSESRPHVGRTLCSPSRAQAGRLILLCCVLTLTGLVLLAFPFLRPPFHSSSTLLASPSSPPLLQLSSIWLSLRQRAEHTTGSRSLKLAWTASTRRSAACLLCETNTTKTLNDFALSLWMPGAHVACTTAGPGPVQATVGVRQRAKQAEDICQLLQEFPGAEQVASALPYSTP